MGIYAIMALDEMAEDDNPYHVPFFLQSAQFLLAGCCSKAFNLFVLLSFAALSAVLAGRVDMAKSKGKKEKALSADAVTQQTHFHSNSASRRASFTALESSCQLPNTMMRAMVCPLIHPISYIHVHARIG